MKLAKSQKAKKKSSLQSNKDKWKLSFLQKMLLYDDIKKNITRCSKSFLIFCEVIIFLKVFSACVPTFKSINSSSLSRKKCGGGEFHSHSSLVITRLKYDAGNRVNWIYWAIYTLNYKLFFKHCILETIFHLSLLFVFVWIKIWGLKSDLHFIFF